MAAVSVRYIVSDVDAAIEFYTKALGFEVKMRPAPTFAWLERGELRLLLNSPGPGGGGSDVGGKTPEPGGWNRFQVEVPDLEATFGELSAAGRKFRSEVIQGTGGKQVIIEDPSGNPVELFQGP